jgi:ferritin-like metal-binding protein YciE
MKNPDTKKDGHTFLSKIKKEVSKIFNVEEEMPAFKSMFLRELRDLYYAEKQQVEKMPDMMTAATTNELSNTINYHFTETQIHVYRLEKIFESLGWDVEENAGAAIRGLLKEMNEGIKNTPEKTKLRDVMIIANAQKIEHYEIATYGTLRTLARDLNMPIIEQILAATLEEEKIADGLFTAIAEGFINRQAEAEGLQKNQIEERRLISGHGFNEPMNS